MVDIDPAWLDSSEQDARDYICNVCEMVLKDPVSGCSQGHEICRACYRKHFAACDARNATKRCPFCNEATGHEKLQKVRKLSVQIPLLDLRCKHGRHTKQDPGEAETPPTKIRKTQGASRQGSSPAKAAQQEEKMYCAWTGKVGDLGEHLAYECPLEPVCCPNAGSGCGERPARQDAASHAKATCRYRNVRCTHCPREMLALEVDKHEAECPDAPVPCPNEGCGEVVTRSSLKGHREWCRREIVHCPCPGCENKIAREDVAKHLEEAKEQHLRKTWAKAVAQQDAIVELKRAKEALEARVSEQERSLEADNHALEAKLSEQERATEELKRSLEAKFLAQQDATQELQRSLLAQQDAMQELQRELGAARVSKHASTESHVFTVTWDQKRGVGVASSPSYTLADGTELSMKSALHRENWNETHNGHKFRCWLNKSSPSGTKTLDPVWGVRLHLLRKNDEPIREVLVKSAEQRGRNQTFSLTDEELAAAARKDGAFRLRAEVQATFLA